MNEFLQIYYTNLAQIIRATGSDPEELFPELELHRQLRKFGKFGVTMAPLVVKGLLAESSECCNMDELAESMSEGSDEAKLMINLSDAKN